MKKLKMFFAALTILVSTAAFAQNISVKGVVVDAADGSQVPFVSIMEKGTMNGVNTNADGEFEITAAANGTLVVSAIGYKTQEVAINGKTQIKVVFEQDAELLNETIVVAFGTATKEAFTGSAAVVGEEKLAKSQVTAVTNALAGAVAGVQLTSGNGAPGSNATIRVRGFSSISAGQAPLIIVDGAPYSGDMNNINPPDIESMTVLKDAASNALYGARGANGVIMITTKRAKSGNVAISFDAKAGINQRALQNYDVISDPAAYYEAHYSSLYNYYTDKYGYSPAQANAKANSVLCGKVADGGLGYQVYSVPQGQNLIGTNGKLNPLATLGNIVNYEGQEYFITPDKWEDYGYRNGVRQEYNLSAGAANEKSNFYASLAYLDNQGITENSDMTRLTARMKADYQLKKWLKVGGNFSYTKFNYNSLGNNGSSNSTGNIWAFTSQIAPIYPLWLRYGNGLIMTDANGFKMMDYGNKMNAGLTRGYLGDANALMDNILNTKNAEGNAFGASGFVDVNFTDHLKLTVNGTVNIDETRTTYVYNPYYGQFDTTGGTISKSHTRAIDVNLQQILNYNNKFGLHNVGLMIGHEYYDTKSYTLGASKSKMFNQENKELSGAVIDGKDSYSSMGEYNNEGYFGRAQYDYDSKIFASASLRRDASSRFAPAHRWGTFWSAGAAWIISKEPWFGAKAFDELKIKASVGSQGNDGIGSYRYVDTFDISNSSGNVATAFSSKGNENITWETNTNVNAGVEFGLLGKISGSLDYFNRITTDMLFSFPVAPTLGYTSYYANVGNMKNQGLELELNFNLFDRKNFKWDINANVTWLQNKITMLDPQKKTTKAYDSKGNEFEGYQSGNFFIGEDLSLYSWYLREYAGVDKDGQSLWYCDVKDESGKRTGERTTTNQYAKADYYVAGSSTIPPVYGGFGTNLEFFGFDFSVNFTYQIGGKQYDDTYSHFMSSPANGANIGYNYHKDIYQSWTAQNNYSNVPRFQYGDTYSAGASTRFLTNSSYLNIQNVNFGYTIPSRLTQKIKVNAVRIYVSAENVWYWSARQGFDPRQSYSSVTNASAYSPMRTISGGVSFKF